MHLPLRHRQTLCRWLVGVLLAVQWLVASHACTAGVLPAANAAAQGDGGGAQEVGVPDCHKAMLADIQTQQLAAKSTHADNAAYAADAINPSGGDPGHTTSASQDDTGLCKAHCTAGQQLPADAPAADAVPHLCGWCIVQVQVQLPLAAAPATTVALAPALGGAPPPGWPPLFIAHGVLRN